MNDTALDDVRRLLRLLAAGGPIRIHCGGGKYSSPKGTVWEKDFFYSGGQLAFSGQSALAGAIEKTEDGPLYQSERWFPVADAGIAGDRLPLPPGANRVTLHFAEIDYPGHNGWTSAHDLVGHSSDAVSGLLTVGSEELQREAGP